MAVSRNHKLFRNGDFRATTLGNIVQKLVNRRT